MPEGPEIRRAADELEAVLAGQTVSRVRFGLPRLRHYSRRLRGHEVESVETRGKALLTHFSNGWSIYSHNQLYGVWKIYSGHRLPESSRSERLLLQTGTHSAVLYSASDISVWPREELPLHPFLQKLGPDIMAADLHWRDIADRLCTAPFSRRNLATLYLDQGFLAGVGNYLRSEILYAAGLNPWRRADSLSRGERGRLARLTLEIARRSYQTGGITLKPALARRLKHEGLPCGKRRFAVFGRPDLPCYGCGTPVYRTEFNSRRLYGCSQCQPQ